MKRIVGLVLLGVMLFAFTRSAFAHAIVLACLPRIGSNTASAPEQLICQFNEPLHPENISLIVTDPSGQRVDRNDARFYQGDDHTLVVSLDPSKIRDGIYTGHWQVQDTLDQGVTSGEFQFGVNTAVPPTPTAVLPGVPMTPTPVQVQTSPTDLISRFLIGAGVVVLVAVGVIYWRMRRSDKVQGQ